VSQERERFLKIMHAYGLEYTLPGEGAIEDVISGTTNKREREAEAVTDFPADPPLTTPPGQTE
jgi:hypothetical protein